MIHEAEAAAARVLRMVEDRAITTVTGKRLPLAGIDTVCVHGDNPQAVAMARTVRDVLQSGGAELRPFPDSLRV